MKRHVHRWKRVRGLHVAIEREFCEFRSRGRQCKARKGEDWSPCDQALWYAAVRIACLTWGVDLGADDVGGLNLWSLSLLRGS